MPARARLLNPTTPRLVVGKEVFTSDKPVPVDFPRDKVKFRQGSGRVGGVEWEFRAYYGTRFIGYISLWEWKCDDCPKDERTVYKAAVDPKFQRKGVATK